MKNKKEFNLKILLITFLLLTINSCNKYPGIDNSKTYGNRTVYGDPEPPLPDKKENDKTLLGIDSDNDGVRDDIEIWINENVKDYNLNNAMKQYARAMNRVFLVYDDGFSAISGEYLLYSSRASKCMFFFSQYIPVSKIVSKLETSINKLIYNTAPRNKARKTMRKTMHMKVLDALNEGRTRYSYCEFKIKDKDRLIARNKKILQQDKIESDRVYKEMKAAEDRNKKEKK